MTAVLELRDVSAAYGPFRALFGVSLTVEPGEAVALVGSNGAGKTTVARVASGLVPPSSARCPGIESGRRQRSAVRLRRPASRSPCPP